MTSNRNLALNTAVGTIFSVSFIPVEEVIKTVVLAGVGATVSIIVSLSVHFIIKKLKERFVK